MDLKFPDDPQGNSSGSLKFPDDPSTPSTVLGEIPKGLAAGVQQVRGFGYGMGALAGEATGIQPVKDWAKEGLADVEAKTPKAAVPSYKNVENLSDAAKYLAYGISTNIPNMALSLTGGGFGMMAGRKLAAGAVEKAVGEGAAKAILTKGAERGSLIGAGLSSIAMETGSIAADQLEETGKVDPLRALAGAIPAGLLDVVPEWYLAKRVGLFGGATGFTGKGLKDRAVQGAKEFGKTAMMEAPTEAMQSVLERASVPGKSLTNREAWDEYIDSFILGGMTGGVFGGVGGMMKKADTPVQQALSKDSIANEIETTLASDDLKEMTEAIKVPVEDITGMGTVEGAGKGPEAVGGYGMTPAGPAPVVPEAPVASAAPVTPVEAPPVVPETAKTPYFNPAGYASEGEALASIKAKRLKITDYAVTARGGRFFVEPKVASQTPAIVEPAPTVEDEPVKSVGAAPTFREFVEAKGKAWPITGSDPDYAPLKAEYDGLKEAAPIEKGTTAEMYRGSGREDAKSVYNELGDGKSILEGGDFWALKEEDAKAYGPNIEKRPMPEFSNPLIVTNDTEWRKMVGDAVGKYDTAEERVSYPNPTGLSPEKMAVWRKGMSDYLAAQGHDALIIDMDKARGDEAKTLGNAFGHSQVFIPAGKAPAQAVPTGTTAVPTEGTPPTPAKVETPVPAKPEGKAADTTVPEKAPAPETAHFGPTTAPQGERLFAIKSGDKTFVSDTPKSDANHGTLYNRYPEINKNLEAGIEPQSGFINDKGEFVTKAEEKAPVKESNVDSKLVEIRDYRGGDFSPTKTRLYQELGTEAVEGIRLADAEATGRLLEMVRDGKATSAEWERHVDRLIAENRVSGISDEVKQEARKRLDRLDEITADETTRKEQGIVVPPKIDLYDFAEGLVNKGIDRQSSYGQYVMLMDLKPQLSAKDWYKIYDSVKKTAATAPVKAPREAKVETPVPTKTEGKGTAAVREKIKKIKAKKAKELKTKKEKALPLRPPAYLPNDIESLILNDMRGPLSVAEGGEIEEFSEGSGSEFRHTGSENPPWLMEIMKGGKATKKEVLNTFKRIEAGDELTPKQDKIAGYIFQEVDILKSTNHYQQIEEEMEGIKDAERSLGEEGITAREIKESREDISAGILEAVEEEGPFESKEAVLAEWDAFMEDVELTESEKAFADKDAGLIPVADFKGKRESGDLPGMSEAETFELTPKGEAYQGKMRENKPKPKQEDLFGEEQGGKESGQSGTNRERGEVSGKIREDGFLRDTGLGGGAVAEPGKTIGEDSGRSSASLSEAIRSAPPIPHNELNTIADRLADDPSKNQIVPKGERISLENILVSEMQKNTGALGGQVTNVGTDNVGEGIFEIERPYGKLVYNEATGEVSLTPAPITSNMAAEKAKFGVDKTLLLQTLSKDIVNNDLSGTIANETIQNALDSFLPGQKDKKIDIELHSDFNYDTGVGISETEVIVRDNGKGMTKSEVAKNLMRLGAKGKTGTESRGGYGLAKAAFILAPRRVSIETVKNGEWTRLTGTREQFFGIKGAGDPTVETERVSEDTKNGTTFKLYFFADKEEADKTNSYPLDRWSADSAFKRYIDKGVYTSGIEISFTNGYQDKKVTVTRTPKELPQVFPKVPLSIQGNKLTMWFVEDPDPPRKMWNGKYQVHVETLNKGLALFGITAGNYNIDAMWEQPKWKLIIDFDKTTDVRDINYPFLRNRTEMSKEVEKEVSRIANEKIKVINERQYESNKTDFMDMVQNSPIINGVAVLIPFKDKTEFDRADTLIRENGEIVSSLAGIFNSFQKILEKIGGKKIELAMTVDPKVHGYRSNPAVVGHELYAINPFAITGNILASPIFTKLIDAGYDSDTAMASNLVHTLVHEYTHNDQQNHSEEFTIQLATNYMQITHGQLARLEQQARSFYEKHGQDLRSLQGHFSGMGKGGSRLRDSSAAVYPSGRYTGREEGGRGVQNAGARGIDYSRVVPPIPPTTKKQSGPPQSASWSSPEPSRMSDFIYTFVDKHKDLRDVVKAIKKVSSNLADSINPDIKQRLYASIVSEKSKEFLDKEFTPILRDMVQSKVSLDDFQDYLWNRTAEETNSYIASINPALPDKGSGITTTNARKYLASLDPAKKRAYERLAKQTDKILAENRKLIVDYQLESQSSVDKWAATYPHYAPLFREDIDAMLGTGEGFSVTGPTSRKRKGSERKVIDILAHIAEQREHIIARGEKNILSTALYNLAKAYPNSEFWSIAKPRVIKDAVNVNTGEPVPDLSYRNKNNVVMSRQLDGPRDKITGAIIPGTARIVERGVEFNTNNKVAERMSMAFKNLDMDTLGQVLGISAKVTRFIASMNTQYNVVFGAVNFVRDLQSAMFNLSSTPISGKQPEVRSHLMPALKTIYSGLRGNDTGPLSADWDEFRRLGGPTGYRDLFRTSKDRTFAIKRELLLLRNGRPIDRVANKAISVVRWISDYNTMMENAVRLATYKTAVNAGISKEQAVILAKDITVDFNKKGQIATQAGALYAFFNANVQGSARMIQTLKGPAGKKIMAGGILLGVMQSIAMAAAGFDDEDPPEFVRERNIIIPIGGKKYVTIPMPLGLHILPNIGRITSEWAMGGFKKPLDKMANLVSVMVESFNPMGASGVSAQSITPTALDPFIALAENKDWTGKQIFRENYSSLAPTPGFTRTKDTATWFSKNLSWALNRMSGGTDYKPGLFSPTPDQIDYLVGQFTGGVGRESTKIVQAAQSMATGEELPTYKIPLAGRFYGSTEGQSNQATTFYHNLKILNQHEAEIKGRQKNREPLGDYLKENPEARYWGMANKAEGTISRLTGMRRKLLEKDASKEAIKAIDALITSHMKRFNETIKQAER